MPILGSHSKKRTFLSQLSRRILDEAIIPFEDLMNKKVPHKAPYTYRELLEFINNEFRMKMSDNDSNNNNRNLYLSNLLVIVDQICEHYGNALDNMIWYSKSVQQSQQLSNDTLTKRFKDLLKYSGLLSQISDLENHFINACKIVTTNQGKNVQITTYLADFKLLGCYELSPYYLMYSPTVSFDSQLSPDIARKLLEAFKKDDWKQIFAVISGSFLNEIKQSTPEIGHLLIGESARMIEKYQFQQQFLLFFHIIALVHDLAVQADIPSAYNLFVRTEDKLLGLFSAFLPNINLLRGKYRILLTTFHKNLRANSTRPFTSFYPVINGSWVFFPQVYLKYFGYMWGSFIEVMLTDIGDKGTIFEERIVELFKEDGFHTWDNTMRDSFNNLVQDKKTELGKADVDVIVQDGEELLLLQCKSVSYKRSSFRSRIRDGREQLTRVLKTRRENREIFKKQFLNDFQTIDSYVVTSIAIPYKFTSQTNIGVITYGMIKNSVQGCKGNLQEFKEKLGINVAENRKNFYEIGIDHQLTKLRDGTEVIVKWS